MMEQIEIRFDGVMHLQFSDGDKRHRHTLVPWLPLDGQFIDAMSDDDRAQISSLAGMFWTAELIADHEAKREAATKRDDERRKQADEAARAQADEFVRKVADELDRRAKGMK